MGAAVPFLPLAAAVAAPLAAKFLGPKPPKQQQAPQVTPAQAAQQQFKAPEPPKQPTLADASVEKARRQQRTGSVRTSTLRTSPQGLLDEAGTATAGASLLA